MRKIIPYNQNLVAYAKILRDNMTLGEIALWRKIKGKKRGIQFSDLNVKNNSPWVLQKLRVKIK